VMQKINRGLDMADYALCRLGVCSFPTWQTFLASDTRQLYAGKLRRGLPQYSTHFGITPFYASTRNIHQDVTLPFRIPDDCVDAFQSEDVFEHIDYAKLASVFKEIYRVLVPGGLFRLSLPDYNFDLYAERCQRGLNGEFVFDPSGGGRLVDGTVVDGGHVWFPTIDSVKRLFSHSPFGLGINVHLLQYNNPDGTFQMSPIDYSLGNIQRTPDHDVRVRDRPRPISIVVDAFKPQ